MTPPDPDAEARRTLRRHRAFATGLLVLMAALTLGSYALPASTATDLLQAAAKAGFVGGIADWFAVTALFRHPLGIPIPHTAIIPAQKERLGAALGRFVATHVFTGAEVAGVLSPPRPARHPAPLPRRPRLGAPRGDRARRDAAAHPRHRGGRPRPPSRRPHRAAHPGRTRRRPGGGARAAQPGRGRPPPGGVRLRPRPASYPARRQGGHAARRRSRNACASRAAGWSAGHSAPRSRGACWRR